MAYPLKDILKGKTLSNSFIKYFIETISVEGFLEFSEKREYTTEVLLERHLWEENLRNDFISR